MYHRIDLDRPADPFGRDLTVAPERFQEQLQTIRSLGLRAISMSELALGLRKHASLERTVVLTFDDGYADQARYELPLPRRTGAPATFYLVTGMLGRPKHLDWAEVRKMQAEGMDIGGHGITHDDLALMAPARQAVEIFGCLRILREQLRTPVATYAYPSGRFNADTLRIEREAGVPVAGTTDLRKVIPPAAALPVVRHTVRGDGHLDEFAQAIDGALERPQVLPQ